MLIRFADKDTEPLANERLGFLKSLVFCVTKEILGIRRIFRRDVFFLFLSFLCLISAEFSAAADGTTSSQVQKEHPVVSSSRERREEILSFTSLNPLIYSWVLLGIKTGKFLATTALN